MSTRTARRCRSTELRSWKRGPPRGGFFLLRTPSAQLRFAAPGRCFRPVVHLAVLVSECSYNPRRHWLGGQFEDGRGCLIRQKSLPCATTRPSDGCLRIGDENGSTGKTPDDRAARSRAHAIAE